MTATVTQDMTTNETAQDAVIGGEAGLPENTEPTALGGDPCLIGEEESAPSEKSFLEQAVEDIQPMLDKFAEEWVRRDVGSVPGTQMIQLEATFDVQDETIKLAVILSESFLTLICYRDGSVVTTQVDWVTCPAAETNESCNSSGVCFKMTLARAIHRNADWRAAYEAIDRIQKEERKEEMATELGKLVLETFLGGGNSGSRNITKVFSGNLRGGSIGDVLRGIIEEL
jgi:hypothetical protein